jgi:hypothetical protein
MAPQINFCIKQTLLKKMSYRRNASSQEDSCGISVLRLPDAKPLLTVPISCIAETKSPRIFEANHAL